MTLDPGPSGRPPGLGTSRTPHPFFTRQGPRHRGSHLVSRDSSPRELTAHR